ncbi:hypothetical protein [Roseateles chitinivorans]|uniref:hypothetical protein n=1 Tax=Roseateles chitinivorans TaxID=2917965 RepID=UPI003D6731E9
MSVAMHAGSLRARLLRRLALQSMAGLGVVCVAVYVVIFLTLDQRQNQTLDMKREAVEHLLREGRGAHDLDSVRHLLNDFLAGHDELTLSVADNSGHIFLPPQRAASADVKVERFPVPLPPDLGGAGTASLAFDQSKDKELLLRLAWTLGFAAVGGSLVLSAAAALGPGANSRPFVHLSDRPLQ